MNPTANTLTAGETFTDETGHTFTVVSVDHTAGGTRQGVYVFVEGQGHPEFYLRNAPVTLDDDTKAARAETLKRDMWHEAQVRDARAELARMKEWGQRNEPADHRIEYANLDGTGRRVSRLTTRDGFLKAIIRLYTNRDKFDVYHVD